MDAAAVETYLVANSRERTFGRLNVGPLLLPFIRAESTRQLELHHLRVKLLRVEFDPSRLPQDILQIFQRLTGLPEMSGKLYNPSSTHVSFLLMRA